MKNMRRSISLLCMIVLVVQLFSGLSVAAVTTEEAPVQPVSAKVANPYLPMWEHIPDGEPRIFPDPETGKDRLYIYGSHDSKIGFGYCGADHVAWSAPVEDLTDWRCEGELINTSALVGVKFVDAESKEQVIEESANRVLYAPDVIYYPDDNTYYMFLFPNPDNKIFVATSKSPAGPFTNPKYVCDGFDPAVLVDDELDANGMHKVYLYYSTESGRDGFGCQLDPKNGMQVIEGTMHYPDTYKTNENEAIAAKSTMLSKNLAPFHFFEGPSIRKVNGWYLLSYQRSAPTNPENTGNGKLAEIGWAYSKNPYGDPNYPVTELADEWHFGGVIVSNLGERVANPYAEDPANPDYIDTFYGENTHGGMVQIDGQWYQVYHRATGNGMKRQSLMEPFTMEFDPVDGHPIIEQVEMTSQGVQKDGLDPFQSYYAAIACYEIGGKYPWLHFGDFIVYGNYPVINCTTDGNYDANGQHNGWYPVQQIRNRTWLGYKYFNFGTGVGKNEQLKLQLTLKELAAGTINIYASEPKANYNDTEKPKTLIGTITLTGENQEAHVVEGLIQNPSALTGKKGIYLEFLSDSEGDIAEFNELKFVKEVVTFAPSTANPYLPMWEHIPDGEPRIFSDPETGKDRLYIYGSHDSKTGGGYCGVDHVAWSAPVDDLTNWRSEGELINIDALLGVTYTDAEGKEQVIVENSRRVLYAPDVIYYPDDGTYYMFLFPNPDNKIFVATSKSPAGPFTNPKYVCDGFDPAVLVDDELDENGMHKVYLYYSTERGRDGFGCQLDPKNGMQVIEGTMHYPDTYKTSENEAIAAKSTMLSKNLAPFHFFEGPSIRKVNGWYLLSYQRSAPTNPENTGNGKLAEIGWAYSKNPYGDPNYPVAELADEWHFGGVIVSNLGENVANPYAEDPANPDYIDTFYGENTHGGMVQIDGQWYQVYHRATGNGNKRQSLIEPFDMTFDPVDGHPIIEQVEMTSQGMQKNGLDPYKTYYAAIACYEIGGKYVTGQWGSWIMYGKYPVFNCTMDGNYDANGQHNGWYPVQQIRNRTWLGYKYFNFGDGIPEGKELVLELTGKEYAPGIVNVYASDPKVNYNDTEKPKTLIGTIALTGENQDVHTVEGVVRNSASLVGKKGIYLEFLSEAEGNVVELNEIGFKLADKLAITEQPVDFAGKVGDTAVFTVETNRSDVTYQWFYSNNGWSWSKSSMEGCTTDTLEVPMKAFRMGQQYKVVVTDSMGGVVESQIVTLTQAPSKAVIVENPADVTVSVGETAAFAVKAEGEGLTYQWMYSNNGGASWSRSTAPGATTANLSIEAKAFRNGQMYKCIVTDANGNAVESTAAAIVIAK